ncbi:GNAT family N-acetyltransferase [Sphaerisporangium aureirubrum]|uniref:GNAT family N-acetyltransferase n=1 Tax=Sphaerisporangium aureirubrum TaxID=1544736 RepID=A0ABW1NQS7_9ACTN
MLRTQAPSPPVSPAAAPAVPAVEIRPARMDDEERVGAFVAGLSPRTLTLRFFTGYGRTDRKLVRALIAVDERRDVLLAVDGGERVLGHAMGYLRDGSTEIAVMVADEWQGRGIGSRLVRALLRRAVARGAHEVGMDVMGDNRRVLAMIKRRWPGARMRIEAAVVEVAAPIGPL